MPLLVSTRGKLGVISGDIHGTTYDIIRGMPGRKRYQDKEFIFELSASNLEHLKDNLAHALWSKAAKAELEKVEGLRAQEKTMQQVKLQGPPESFTFNWKTVPYAHQKTAFFLSRDKHAFGLFMEMGTGKTKVTLDTAAYLYGQGEITSMLILAPNGVHRQWINEQIPVHLPDWVKYKAAFYQATLPKDQKKILEEVVNFDGGLRIVTVNTEALSGSRGYEFVSNFLKKDPACLFVIDESIRIKTPGSSRTKNCLKLAALAKYRRILSGAPVTKGVEDLYAQFRFLDPDILGHNSYYSFRNHYCVMGGYEDRQIVQYKNMPQLQERIEGWSYRVRKQDCLDLPAKIYIKRPVELTDEQKARYKEIKNTYFTQFNEKEQLSVLNGASLVMRLQQVICGFLPNDGGTEIFDLVTPEKNPRIEAVREILEEVDGKVIIWARFTRDIANLRMLMKRLDVECVTYHGETKQQARTDAIENFRNNPATRVFIGNPAAAGTGLNLAVANTVIYYSNDFNADTRWQSEDRTHRIGMTGTCTYIDLFAPATVDSKIISALKSKKSISNMVIDRQTFMEFLDAEE
jgi:SNF2 family DNA or RNA helicase